MGRIPEETIQEIRDRVDIVALIGRYVELKKAGRSYKGRCPFHDEKTPSFNVHPDRQFFHCFGCQAGGDAIVFLMKHENLTFPEAARTLAGECGIVIPETGSGDRGISEQLFAANQLTQDFYRAALTSDAGEPARSYLDRRGLDAAAIERFGIGFAPDSWDALGRELKRHSIPEDVATTAGLVAPRERSKGTYDRLRGRITFPISDVRGRVVGFGGRALQDGKGPKYLNTPESPIFHKREALYGFPYALEGMRKAERAIACEGYFDRIALERAGLSEAVATCGTALTPGHAKQISRRTNEIVLLFDGDEAGQKAVEKALAILLPSGMRVRAALLPAGDDPDSFLVEHGAEALRALVARAPDAIEIVIQRAVKHGCATPAERAAAVGYVAPFVKLIHDPVEQVEYVRRLALVTGADSAAVERVVRRGASSLPAPQAPPPRTAAPPPRKEGGEERHFHLFAQLLYRSPGLLDTDVYDRIAEVLPEGSWKAIILLLAEAADGGCLDDAGAIDLFQIEERLDAEATARLRAVAMDETLEENETPPSQILEDLLNWFDKRRRTTADKNLTRQLRDPNADVGALLAEKQRQLEERRAAADNGADHRSIH